MKKIGIITVYHTENTGSVLQATALKDFLTLSGYDVYKINTRNKYSAHSKFALLKNILKSIKTKSDFRQCISRYNYFERYIRNTFLVVNADQVESCGFEKLVIGSDTVWNIDSRYFKASEDLFWGMRWKKIPIISYAVSIANSSIEKLSQLTYPEKAVKSLEAIGVRDTYTQAFVETVLKKQVALNCDPTMLFGVDYYREKCFPIKERFILLYLFEEIRPELMEELKEFAFKRNLKIVCLGKFIKGCDIWKISTLDNFLSYFDSADYVITNTFHGTAFSIIFNKNFIVLDYNKIKVNEILGKVELNCRLTKNNLGLFECEIDYKKVNSILDQFRESSKRYLLQALKQGK